MVGLLYCLACSDWQYGHVASFMADLSKEHRPSNQSFTQRYDMAASVRSFLPNLTKDKVVTLRAL